MVHCFQDIWFNKRECTQTSTEMAVNEMCTG